MTNAELAELLSDIYGDDTIDLSKSRRVILFGIIYAQEIKESGMAMSELSVSAGLTEGYGVEVGKGVALSNYVQLKPCRQ